VNSKTNTNNN